MATGGGAFKYYDRIKEALGVEVIREDEMECLIIGKLRLNDDFGETKMVYRPRFLHHGDPERGVHL
jgi:hypothetical protein